MQENRDQAGSRHEHSTSDVELQHHNISENSSIQSSKEDVPPNGGYAWVCTLCVFLINAHTWGVNGAWGVMLNHFISEGSYPGASRMEYALIGGLSISQALMISPLVGTTQDKIGTRNTLLIGTVGVFLALFASSYATKIWHLFLSQGVCFGWGMGFLYITATAILPHWFSTHRSLALGLSTSGAGLGGLAYSLGASHGIETLGIAWTYRILAICTAVINFICSFLLKDRRQPRISQPNQPRRHHFNLADLARVEVLLLVFWGVVTELGYITIYYSLPNFASTIGLSDEQGALANALLNLGLGLGRPIVGYYSDVFGRINMAMSMTAVCSVMCLALWIPAQSFGLLAAFAVLAGSVCGTFWSTIAPVLAEVVGIEDLGCVFGLICFALVLPTTFAEPIAMQLVHAAGPDGGVRQYLVAQVFVTAMFILGAASLWVLRSWKIFQLEREEKVQRAEGMLNPDATSTVSKRMEGFWLTPGRMLLPKRV